MNNTIREFHKKTVERENKEWEARIKKNDDEYLESKKSSLVWKSTLLDASKDDYVKWLNDLSVVPTHHYGYDMHTEYWFIATENFTITPLYGSSSINIIVPIGIDVEGESGHNGLYFFDKEKKSSDWIPFYNNL